MKKKCTHTVMCAPQVFFCWKKTAWFGDFAKVRTWASYRRSMMCIGVFVSGFEWRDISQGACGWCFGGTDVSGSCWLVTATAAAAAGHAATVAADLAATAFLYLGLLPWKPPEAAESALTSCFATTFCASHSSHAPAWLRHDRPLINVLQPQNCCGMELAWVIHSLCTTRKASRVLCLRTNGRQNPASMMTQNPPRI